MRDSYWTNLRQAVLEWQRLMCGALICSCIGAAMFASPIYAQAPMPPAESPATATPELPAPMPPLSQQPAPARGATRSPFATTTNSNFNSYQRGNSLVAGRARTKMAPSMIGDLFGTTNSLVCIFPFETSAIARGIGQPIIQGNSSAPIITGPVGSFLGVNVTDNGLGLPDASGNGRQFAFLNSQSQPYPQSTYTGLAEVNANSAVIDAGPFTAIQTTQFVNPDGNLPNDVGNQLFNIVGQPEIISIPSPSSATVVGRSKLAENGSPIPRDRVFFNYSYFDNAALTSGGVAVHRFTPGFEKTFNNGYGSIEFRAPFASTLNSDLLTDGSSNGGDAEFGNITTYFKHLIYLDDYWAHSVGVGVSAPTADDVRLKTPTGATLLQIRNDSFHVLPFFGSLFTPTEELFIQGMIQYDIDTRGNRVEVANLDSGGLPTNEFQSLGRATDAMFIYWSLSAGYWVYRDPDAQGLLTGLAPMVELHYNQSLQADDVLTGLDNAGNLYQIGAGVGSLQVLNLTMGATAVIGRSGTLSMAYVTPIGNSADQQFNGELRVFFNWYFGQ
ncbi:hypothetical protein GC163_08520 [bacterium]|nr:hypothetical protein [bacterium]